MKKCIRNCGSGMLSYLKWLSKQTVGLLNAIFFLTMAGEIGGFIGIILIVTMICMGSFFTALDDQAELSILNAIAHSDAMIIHKETGDILAQ